MKTSTELDSADPLARYRDRFLRDSDVVSYLDGNSLGRPLLASIERMQSFLTEQWGGRLVRGWDEGWLDLPARIGDDLGRVALGAAPGQIVVGDSTTVLLYKLIRAAVEARPDRTEIIIDRDSFPTDRYVVEGIAAERGLTVTWLGSKGGQPSDSGVTARSLTKKLTDNTAVLVLSHVAYRSGYLAEVPAITALAHEAGALVVWDLSHSVGVVPTSLDEWGVDLAVGCTYKYLSGGPGSPAFAYVRSNLQGELRQPIQGWLGAKVPFDMTQGYTPADGIRGFTSGTPPIIGMLALQDMIALIEEVGIDAIRAKSVALTEFAIALADDLLPDARLASPREAEHRGSHITLDRDGFDKVVPKLWAQGVIPDFRAPNGIRVGLAPLSTSFTEVELGMFAIRHPGH
ncbi:MAG: kynureninase [Microbacteriaceae bacterium]|jgi:kynureninase|nr:kynureninase [Microbacteriaceae bacterium]HEV7957700.1 aminotransferase class V-fold PLP-dependent enzyme [Marisediminicola sp.]